MTETKKIFTRRTIIMLVLVVLIAPFLPMIISSDWGWWEAWVYAAISIVAFIGSRALAGRRHPDLLMERARFLEAKDTKPWDVFLAPALAFGSLFILVVAGLDRLYGWTPDLSSAINVTGLTGLLVGFIFSSWAPIENRFFSGTVRIQKERGHHVVTGGPYRIVRHPGYAGALLGYLFIPLMLDSIWAFIPAGMTGVIVFIRTALEDKTLQEELPGYQEYARKTRYRLLPGIW
jgi:protein-S-isoprenylcysteine O-methyltransferase Ste14